MSENESIKQEVKFDINETENLLKEKEERAFKFKGKHSWKDNLFCKFKD